jgi:hypothetical protein
LQNDEIAQKEYSECRLRKTGSVGEISANIQSSSNGGRTHGRVAMEDASPEESIPASGFSP